MAPLRLSSAIVLGSVAAGIRIDRRGGRAEQCYGEFAHLVSDEGAEVGSIGAESALACKSACDRNALCNSVSYCPEWSRCWLKDRILDGSEPTTPNGECKTYYKTPCSPPSPAPTVAPTPPAPQPAPSPSDPDEDPQWGCGLLGAIPGIDANGFSTPETQRLIDGIKGSSSFNKVNYWNWNLVPELGSNQHLTSDFIFIPEMWGQGVVDVNALRPAGESNFTIDRDGGARSPATMSHLFMGSNEPDIVGSCMGSSFGTCLEPECCWGPGVVATGVGFWPFAGCDGSQPLPTMWEDPLCIDSVMGHWKQTAAAARYRGYKYLTTPLVAFNISYIEQFIQRACTECQSIECGCPVYVGFHFYAYDCQPRSLGGYAGFQARLDEVTDLMERYPFIKGAVVNEVGMLNCQSSLDNPICVPDSGRYPASEQPNNACPRTEELPNGMASFVEDLFDMVIAARTSDGRDVVKAFSWFMLDQAGGTYNQQIFNGFQLNEVGEAYIRSCQRWEQTWKSRAQQ